MDIELKELPKSEVSLKISISPEEMRGYFEQAVKNLAKQANLPGFRKGKAPRSVLESRTGPHHIAHEAMELAVAESYYKAVMKHDLRPVGRPQTDLKHEHDDLEKDGLSFTATVAVMPPVTLGDYKKVSVKPQRSEYSDKQVDEALDQLRKGRAGFAQVTRAAKEGDRVEIDFVGKQGKGKDKAEVPGAKSENHPLVLGQGGFIPGFEEELVGLKTGQVKTFTLTFPKDYHEQSLAGKPVEFTVTMRQVQETKLPELDDDFAKGFGAKSVGDLRKRLAENLKKEKEQEARQKTEQEVVNQVVDRAKVEVPEELVGDELTRMFAEFRQHVERQGIPFDKYLEQSGKTEDDFRKDQRGEAERRVKMSLVLNAIQEKEKIEVSEKRLKEEIATQLAAVPDDKIKERIKGDEFKAYVRRILGNRQAVDKLVEYATG
ncbi:MAG: trigger factor [bacterium]|nr:trigger factor [bacterium]MDZ4248235.1 trigger factor [Patescibacteria group bacterium]